jgi:hypothetical protein
LKAPHRYARRTLGSLLFVCCAFRLPAALGQDLSQGIASWAEATVGRSSVRWVGQRVAVPLPTARPASLATLDSELWPLRVHISEGLSPARWLLARDVLLRAERSYALFQASGLLSARAEPAPGHSMRRDLYLVERDVTGAARDDTEVVSDLDASLSFAMLDARTLASARDACVAQALLEAELLELDPAESEVVRKASARYFAWLVSGDSCPPAQAASSLTHDAQGVLHDPEELARWFRALGARQDRNRGVFMENMWQFARQHTWEGSGLRGSPDLFEAIAKALSLSHDKLEEVSGELANDSALAAFTGALERDPRRVAFSGLPAHLPASAALDVLDTSYQLIDLEGARPGARLTIWARGEYGVRWVLSATLLDRDGRALGTVNAPVHKHPETELTLELTGESHFVLASVTNMGNGLPDPDLARAPELARSTRLIIARANDGL